MPKPYSLPGRAPRFGPRGFRTELLSDLRAAGRHVSSGHSDWRCVSAASAGAASALRLLSEVLVVASEVLVDHNSHELVCFKTSVRHLYPSLLNLPTLGHLDTTQKL